jgi:hypothetical protein
VETAKNSIIRAAKNAINNADEGLQTGPRSFSTYREMNVQVRLDRMFML